MPTMNVNLPGDLYQFVSEQLEHGGYSNQSEVIREGLRLLRSRNEKLFRLRSEIQAGFEDFENGDAKSLTEELLGEIAGRAKARLTHVRRKTADRG